MLWPVILMLFSPLYLIHDRDNKYTLHADSLLEDVGTEVIRLPHFREQRITVYELAAPVDAVGSPLERTPAMVVSSDPDTHTGCE